MLQMWNLHTGKTSVNSNLPSYFSTSLCSGKAPLRTRGVQPGQPMLWEPMPQPALTQAAGGCSRDHGHPGYRSSGVTSRLVHQNRVVVVQRPTNRAWGCLSSCPLSSHPTRCCSSLGTGKGLELVKSYRQSLGAGVRASGP